MKKILILLLIFISFYGQDLSSIGNGDTKNLFNGGLGIANINGQTYYSITLDPEISFGKFGVGLNVQLLFHPDNGFRSDMYDEGAGWLRIIRYIRYGHKSDSLYVRLGSIDNGTLGNGFIMYHYTNAGNYENRKIGLEYDMDFGVYGFESLYSNFGKAEILGLRGYYRPLTHLKTPILNTLEVGLTHVTDFDNYSVDNTNSPIIRKADNISAFGFDVGVKVLDMEYLKWKFYFDQGFISNYGSGTGVGSAFLIPNIAGLFEFGIKYEIRWVGDEFLPSLFSYSYEQLKATDGVSSALNAVKSSNGDFSELAVRFLNLFTIRGNYSKIHDVKNAGLFYADLVAPDLGDLITISARYSKSGLDNFSDSFTFNTHSLAEFELGYAINSYLLFSTTYRYTWIEVKDKKTGENEIESQETIIPQVKLRFQF